MSGAVPAHAGTSSPQGTAVRAACLASPAWLLSPTGQKRHATAFHLLPQVTPMNAPCRLLLPLALFSSAAVRRGCPLTVNGCVLQPDSQCANADLRGADLSNQDLRRINLAGANSPAPTCATPTSTRPIWKRPTSPAPRLIAPACNRPTCAWPFHRCQADRHPGLGLVRPGHAVRGRPHRRLLSARA